MQKFQISRKQLLFLALPVLLFALKSCIWMPQSAQDKVITKKEYLRLVKLKDSLNTEYKILVSKMLSKEFEMNDSLRKLNREVQLTGYNPDSLEAEYQLTSRQIKALLLDLENYKTALDSQPLETEQQSQMILTESQRVTQLMGQLNKLRAKLDPEPLPPSLLLTRPGSYHVPHRNGQYATYVVDLSKEAIQVHWKNSKGRKYKAIKGVKERLDQREKNISLITNGGMYDPQFSPQGLYVENGKEHIPIDLTQGPEGQFLNFYMHPNGVFFQDKKGVHILPSEAYPGSTAKVDFATQSGPMLLIDGEIHPLFNSNSPNRKLRSGVGVIDQQKVVFAISTEPVSFHEFATLFRDCFGCKNALYLDGVVSRMYLPELDMKDLGGPFGPIISVTEKH